MISLIITIIGGITLFLFGLNSLRSSLFNLTSEKFKLILSRFTNTNIKAFLLGITSTAIIQSSSGVTAITIILLSTDILSLKSAVLIILGSNIGTCFTPFLFTFNIGNYSLLLVILGYFLSIKKKDKIKLMGNIIISLGLIFLGLNFLDLGLNDIVNNSTFISLFTNTRSNFFSLITSIIITSLLQSSSATIAITQSLYQNNIINIASSCFFMLGANIGTTISSYSYAKSLNNNAKLAIKINILFNILGSLIFIIVLTPFINLLSYLRDTFDLNKELIVAYSHLIFNLSTSLVTFIFFNFLFDFSLRKIFKVDTVLKMC